MIHHTYHDQISISVVFDGSRVLPKVFSWGKNDYQITRVLNIYSSHDGQERVYYFSVSTETEFFKLQLHTNHLSWFLVEHYQE